MGASTFSDSGVGKTAKSVFKDLRDEALYMFGHSGYTGTIAEKSSFVQFTPPAGMSPDEFIRAIEDYDESNKDAHPLVREAWKIYDDKWGPAVCVERKNKAGEKEFVFFGWASD